MCEDVALLGLFLIAGIAAGGALGVFVVDLLNRHEIADRLNGDGHDGV